MDNFQTFLSVYARHLTAWYLTDPGAIVSMGAEHQFKDWEMRVEHCKNKAAKAVYILMRDFRDLEEKYPLEKVSVCLFPDPKKSKAMKGAMNELHMTPNYATLKEYIHMPQKVEL